MACRDIIVVGASAGGVEALSTLVGGFPTDLPAAVFIVLHRHARSCDVLPDILNRHGRLPAVSARPGAFKRGHLYIAPPDYHLVLRRSQIRLTRSPYESLSRPSVDVLFRSAAVSFGPRVIGVILTGALDDGTAGLIAVKRRGGVAVVQDPEDALVPDMPRSALRNAGADYCRPLDAIPSLLHRLACQGAPDGPAYPVPIERKHSPSVMNRRETAPSRRRPSPVRDGRS